jgi:molybdopterin-guanine dinucleotide biosynthesis protein A
VSSTVYNKTINFNEKYSTTPFDDVRLLEYAERDIANIDLCLYMFNNKTLNPLFAAYNTDFMEILKSHKDIIIDNINDFLLRKKIQKKQDKSQQRRPKKSK